MNRPEPETTGGNRPYRVALVGNPNVGKSVVFRYLTGRTAIVSNYPGTTVEVLRGSSRMTLRLPAGAGPTEIIDTPGINGLIPNSEDERVARNLLLDEPPDAVIQMADARNLRRALMITSQLGELAIPTVLALNMWDEATARGIAVDVAALSAELGIPVAPTVATERRGLHELTEALALARPPRFDITYGPGLGQALRRSEALLQPIRSGRRGLALMCLAGDDEIEQRIGDALGDEVAERLRAVREEEQHRHADPLRYAISRRRSAQVDALCARLVHTSGGGACQSGRAKQAWLGVILPLTGFLAGYALGHLTVGLLGAFLGPHPVWQMALGTALGAVMMVLYYRRVAENERRAPRTVTDHVGALALHPLLALPLVVLILWGMYLLVGQFGAGACVDFIENNVFGTAAVDAKGHGQPGPGFQVGAWHLDFGGINYYLGVFARRWIPPDHLLYKLFLGSDAGLIQVGLTYSVAILLPVVTFFFLCFGLLEDSGLLPRLGAMLDRLFKRLGLSGKAVLPMVMGLGCDTMATLTTRILETRRERIIAILLLALAVPCSAQLGVIAGVLGRMSGLAFAIYVATIFGVLVLVGWLAARLLPGETPDFIMEIPPIRVPQLGNIVGKTAYRVKWFMMEAVPLFLGGTLLMFFLQQTGVLAAAERVGRPVVVHLLGLPESTTRGFILGFLRRDYAAVDILKHPESISPAQVLVAMVVITLFVPCIAHFFVMIKEQGLKAALLIVAFIVPFAVLVGALLRLALQLLPAGALGS